MKIKGVGIDIVESRKFSKFIKDRNHPFILKNFSQIETQYYSFRDASPHFAGTFAAKEAILKALGEIKMYLPDIEVRHDQHNRLLAFRKQKK